jgi:hypothetical protein
MGQIVTSTGKTANIAVAGFKDAMRLNNAVLAAFAQHGLKEFDIAKAIGAARKGDILSGDVDLSALFAGVAGVIADAHVNACLWPCLIKSLYGQEKITEATFEDESAREDFYAIALECVKVNLLPFWKRHLSSFGILSKVTQ